MISRLTTSPATNLEVFINTLSAAFMWLSFLLCISNVADYNIDQETGYPD